MKDEDIFEIENEPEASASSPGWRRIPQKLGIRKNNNNKEVVWWKSVWARQAAFAIGGALVLVFLAHLLLLQITRHSKGFPVPDFTGMSVAEASVLAKKEHLRLDVTDSVDVHHIPRGSVFKQNPQPHMQVKKNRRILLTVNSLVPRKVAVPNVVGFSLRQAKTVLNAQGLDVGSLTYVSDIATNNVLGQFYKGSTIASGVRLSADSKIDLTLGINDPSVRTSMPALVGLTLEQARDLLLEHSLNTGRVQFDSGIKNYTDSSAAKVYRQIPAAAPQSESWSLGARVDLFLRLDEAKTPTN